MKVWVLNLGKGHEFNLRVQRSNVTSGYEILYATSHSVLMTEVLLQIFDTYNCLSLTMHILLSELNLTCQCHGRLNVIYFEASHVIFYYNLPSVVNVCNIISPEGRHATSQCHSLHLRNSWINFEHLQDTVSQLIEFKSKLEAEGGGTSQLEKKISTLTKSAKSYLRSSFYS